MSRMLSFFISLFTLMAGAVSVSLADDAVIRATLQNSQPKYILYNQTEKGLCGDIYQGLNKRLGAQGIHLELPEHYSLISTILGELESGKADIYCGAGRNAKREKTFHYSSIPVYSVSNVIAVHEDDNVEPASMQFLIDSRQAVASYEGSSTAAFLYSHPVVKSANQYKDLLDALQAVSSGQERYFFYHDLALPYLIRKYQLPVKIASTKFRTYQHWMLYSQQMKPELQQAVDQALVDMQEDGELASIQEKYQR